MAAAIPFLRGGQLNLIVQAAPSLWTGYTSSAMPGWAALNTDTRMFAVAFLFNTLKARHLGARKTAWTDSTERIRLISYLEAILDSACPLIVRSRPAVAPGAAVVLPAATEIDPAAPSGTTFQDQLVRTYGAGGGAATWAGDIVTVTLPQALAAQAEHYMSAQFTFVLALAKKGDMTRQFSVKATRSLQLELGLSNMEIYSDEVAWIATRVINSASLPTEASWAALFASVLAGNNISKRVRTVTNWAQRAGTTKLQILSSFMKRQSTSNNLCKNNEDCTCVRTFMEAYRKSTYNLQQPKNL
ncbi:hypothetical protein HELRODRAFT_171381 [Helobdella robusta]|uniref:Uncharacterized protein n=1 Tax=Helobdella robusta TaxID=6412 RepID=T1F476_HELRO|nr:hypothetical protein HELRODRAFT_171381 [Helobdella robusta]ESO05718.1 hypothetical protein HELRODRAFT_171381 [Helobdella robusta]